MLIKLHYTFKYFCQISPWLRLYKNLVTICVKYIIIIISACKQNFAVEIFRPISQLNCEMSSRTNLLGGSQFKRTQAKYFFVNEAYCLKDFVNTKQLYEMYANVLWAKMNRFTNTISISIALIYIYNRVLASPYTVRLTGSSQLK